MADVMPMNKGKCEVPRWAVEKAVELLQRLTGDEKFIDTVAPVAMALAASTGDESLDTVLKKAPKPKAAG